MVHTIGTHNGKFHCDEALACFMLKRLDRFSKYSIVRSREHSVLEKCEILVDVGGVYDHSKKRYDHHQKGFAVTMDSLGFLETTTKLSSAGLIYAHYGKQLIKEILGVSYDEKMIAIFFRKLYQTFIEAIDAVDNGIKQYDGLPRF
uniref:UPF0160 protein MYG1, mitochondrial n=1 Tax=Heterorhabditis bacteriophora TaxID=37862 RepID=A0A1I7XGK6_HETBA